MLAKRGVCWLVANRHLPYEAALADAFGSVAVRAEGGGYKVFEARK
jgi:16S rRNA (guanine1207-N2)-methyltransferase